MDDLELLPEVIFKRLGNTTSRKSLLNPKEWRNVLYDPATTAEEKFRSSKGIDLKKKRTKRKTTITDNLRYNILGKDKKERDAVSCRYF